MNQNDEERYFWRTGQMWSSDAGPFRTRRARRSLTNRALILIYAGLAAIVVMRLLLR